MQQDEGEQRTAEEQEALSDALSTVTEVPWTTWHAINKCTNYWDKTTNRCRDTAFYSYWLAFEFPWWKDRGLSQSGQGIDMICIKCSNIIEIKISILIFFHYQILTCCRKAAFFTPWTAQCVWAALSVTIVTFLSIGDNSWIYRRKTQLPLQISISADFTIPERILSSMVFFGGVNVQWLHVSKVQYLEHLGSYRDLCYSR